MGPWLGEHLLRTLLGWATEGTLSPSPHRGGRFPVSSWCPLKWRVQSPFSSEPRPHHSPGETSPQWGYLGHPRQNPDSHPLADTFSGRCSVSRRALEWLWFTQRVLSICWMLK